MSAVSAGASRRVSSKHRNFGGSYASAGAGSIGASQGAVRIPKRCYQIIDAAPTCSTLREFLKPLTAGTDAICVGLHPERT